MKAAAIALAVAGASLVAVPQASALDIIIPMDVSPYEIAYQGTNGILGLAGAPLTVSTGAAMAPGTSASTTPIPGGYQFAWQGANHDLWTSGPNGPIDLGGPMAPGTSPSLTALPSGSYEVVYQGTDGRLRGAGSYTGSFGVAMAPGTSPSILALSQPTPYGGAFQVVWQGANNHLWTTGSNGPIDTGGAMAPGTSPSVTTEGSAPYRGYFAAFHGSNGDMWWNDVEVGAFGPRLLDSGMAMAAGTSPSAGDVVAGNLPTTAFQGSNGHLQLFGETHGNNGEFDTGLAMMAGSSPSLRTNMLYDRPGNPLGGSTYYVGYASNTGVLSVYGLNEFGTTVSTDLVQSTGQVAAAGSSPSLVSALNAVYGGSVVGPAAATSSAAAGTAAAPPKPPSTPTIKPDTAPLVTSDTCPTVRAHLKQYAARGIKQVSCQTTTSAAPPTPARPGASANTSPRTNAVTPQIAGSAVCSSTQWTIIRTEQCYQNYVQTKDAIDTSTGDVLGSLTWVSSKDVVLAVNSTQITEKNSISLVDWQGINVGRPVTLTESATCSSLCQVTSPPATRFTLSLNQTETYNFTYQDNPGTQAPDTFNITWSEDQSIPGLLPNPTLVQSAPASIRCDNQFPGNMGAGCVIPSYAPTLVLPLSVYGGAAMNVWVAENYLPGTPGLSTSTPLTRGDPARTTPNRTAICNSFKPFPDPNPFVAVDSCDEYPFASTQQSGAALGATGSNCLEILPTHNPDTGAWEWFDLTRYTFTASQVCVRGHVNQTLNSNVGTMALNPMYTANRMLIGDPFTVQVTQ